MPTVTDLIQALAPPPFLGQPGIECADQDPETFYPLATVDPTPAQAVCRRCPHRAACLQFALDTRQRFGIWGGATPAQRTRILTKQHGGK